MNVSESKKNCIFVGGVPPTVTPDAVKAYFAQFGPVSKIKMNKSRGNQREKTSFPVLHRGCGFIEMATQEGLNNVLHVKEHYLLDQKLDCRFAMTNRERKSYHQTLNQERRKIFIGKLPKTIAKESIEAFFSKLVNIEDTTLIQKDSKDFAICFLLLKEKYAGEKLAGKSFEIAPSVIVDCQMALFPQQLHQRKLAEKNSSEPEINGSLQPSIGDDDDTPPAYNQIGLAYNEYLLNEESKYSDSRLIGQNREEGNHVNDYPLQSFPSRTAVSRSHNDTNINPSIKADNLMTSSLNIGNCKSVTRNYSLVHYPSSSTQGTSQDFSELECQGRRWVSRFEPAAQKPNYHGVTSTPNNLKTFLRAGAKCDVGSHPNLSSQQEPFLGSYAPYCNVYHGKDPECEDRHWSSNLATAQSSQHWSLYRRLKLLKIGKPTQRPGFPRLYSPFSY